MRKIFFLLLFSSSISFGQSVFKGHIKPLHNSNNYVEESIRQQIINYLDSIKIISTNYFIDSVIITKGDTIYIYLPDSLGLKRLDKFAEQKKDKTKRQILPNGNPGNFMTIEYDLRRRKILGYYFDQ